MAIDFGSMLMEIIMLSNAEAITGVPGKRACSSHLCTVQTRSGAGVTVLG
jgi:hypothetical protein